MNNFKFLNKYDVKMHFFEPKGTQNLETTLILLTAIGVGIEKYHKFIHELNEVGFTILTADYPCCGENTPHVDKTVDYNYSDLVYEFVATLVLLSKTKKTVLLGHSLGAHLATLYATQYSISVIGIATGNIHYKNWSGLQKLKIIQVAMIFKLLVKLYGYFPGYKIGFGFRETKGVMNDWCHTALTGNYHYFSEDLAQAKAQSYFINIKDDHFAPLKSTEKLAALFDHVQVEQIEISETLKGNKHSIWLKQPSTLVNKVLAYIFEL